MNRDYYKEAGKPWIISAYTAVRSFNPTQESKIKDIAAERSAREPGGLHGKGKKWLLIWITERINKGAKGSGMRDILYIIKNTGKIGRAHV